MATPLDWSDPKYDPLSDRETEIDVVAQAFADHYGEPIEEFHREGAAKIIDALDAERRANRG